MELKRFVSIGTIAIITGSLASCGTNQDYERPLQETEYTINGLTIYRDMSQIDTDEEEQETCESFVFNYDSIDYYYDSVECSRLGYTDQDYLVTTDYLVYPYDPHETSSNKGRAVGLNYYIYWVGYDSTSDVGKEEYTKTIIDDLQEIDFIESRVADYVPTSVVTPIGGRMRTIYTYSDRYLEDNAYCMQEYTKVLYEDENYQYVYKYQSCSEDKMEHAFMDMVNSRSSTGTIPEYTSIGEIIESYADYIDWCELDDLGIGTIVPK